MINDYNAICDRDTEKTVICMIVGVSGLYDADKVHKDLFTDKFNQSIVEACELLTEQNKPVNQDTIYQTLPTIGISLDEAVRVYTDITFISSSPEVFEASLALLAELAKRRQYYKLASELLSLSTNRCTSLDDIDGIVQKAVDAQKDTTGIVSAVDAVQMLRRQIKDNFNGISAPSLPTGIDLLDSSTGGLHTTDLDLIVARTSQGKTALSLDIAKNVASQGIPVFYISMEMNCTQLVARLSANDAMMPSSSMLYSKLSAPDADRADEAILHLASLPIYFADVSGMTKNKLATLIRSAVKCYECRLIFVDFIQILMCTNNQQTDARFLGDVARMLKDMAKALDVCIVALSQLNRNTSYDEPTLADIRSSGEIAEASDTVIALHRPEGIEGYPYNDYHGNGIDASISIKGTAKLIILKGRNIGLGSTFLKFDAPYTHFYSVPTSELPKVSDAKVSDEVANTDRPF